LFIRATRVEHHINIVSGEVLPLLFKPWRTGDFGGFGSIVDIYGLRLNFAEFFSH